MGAPEIMLATTIISGTVAAMQAREAGKAAQQAADLKAQEYKVDAALASLQGQEQALAIQEDAWSVQMGNIARASPNYDPYSSMSWLAIKDDNYDDSQEAIARTTFNAQLNSERRLFNAQQQQLAGSASLRDSYFTGATSLLKGGYRGAKLSKNIDWDQPGSIDRPIEGSGSSYAVEV